MTKHSNPLNIDRKSNWKNIIKVASYLLFHDPLQHWVHPVIRNYRVRDIACTRILSHKFKINDASEGEEDYVYCVELE